MRRHELHIQSGRAEEQRKAERLPTLGSREEIEGGVEPLPALRAPVMTAAIIRKPCSFY
jgi:hypothetical protein